MEDHLSAALVSGPLVPGRKDANLSMMARVLGEQSAGSDLVIFAEANINGGFWKDGESEYPRLAETVPDGPSSRQAIELARKHRKTICCGLLEQADSKYYITHLLCGPDGLIGTQRKLYTEPGGFFTSGQRAMTIDLSGHRCMILACADAMLPEAPILPALAGATLILAPTDCFYARQEGLLRRLLGVRAMDAGAPILMTFGHDADSKGEGLLAGVVALPNGEFSAFECRTAQEVHVVRATVERPKPPKRRRWDVKSRGAMLHRHLSTYLQDIG